MAFGDIIAAQRKSLQITQKELAVRIKKEDGEPISPQYLNDLERNRRNPPSEFLLKQFAERLKLEPDYLFFIAGQWPADLRDSALPPQTVREGLKAFRRAVERG